MSTDQERVVYVIGVGVTPFSLAEKRALDYPEMGAAAARAADDRATKGTRDHAAARRRPAAISGEAMARRDAFPGAR